MKEFGPLCHLVSSSPPLWQLFVARAVAGFAGWSLMIPRTWAIGSLPHGAQRSLLAAAPLPPLQEASLQLLAEQESDNPTNEQQPDLCNVHMLSQSAVAGINGRSLGGTIPSQGLWGQGERALYARARRSPRRNMT